MTENTPDPKTFDLTDWITGGTDHRPVKEVEVYRDLSLVAEAERIQKAIDRLAVAPVDADGNAEEALGDDSAAALIAEGEAIYEKIRATKTTLRIMGLIHPEQREIENRLKPKGVDQSSDLFTYHVLAKAVTFPGGAQLTPEQWGQFHGAIGQGQFIRITTAYQAAMLQVPDVTAPFSPTSSRKVTGR